MKLVDVRKRLPSKLKCFGGRANVVVKQTLEEVGNICLCSLLTDRLNLYL